MDTALPQARPRALYGKADLARLVSPRSIAIIGASPTPGSFGYRSVENTGFGYAGAVYPVNPRHREILGHTCYGRIEEVPGAVDCAVLCVAREQVLPLLERCAQQGVGSAVIYSSGFAETGEPEGIAQQQRMTDIARASGMRLFGPNCLGVMNFVDRVGLTFQPGLNTLPMITGRIGVVVQSGALGFIITQGMQRGLGFSYTFSPGNSCDVDVCDLINYLIEDEATSSIACLMEGVRDGSRLLAVGRRALEAGKPIIAYKMGNNDLGRRTAQSHTGAMTGSFEAYRAAFDASGIVGVSDFEAVLEAAAFFGKTGKPAARGVGVMSASGGAAVMAADIAATEGISLPPLSPQTSARVREKIPDFGSSANPCDITAASLHDKTMYGHCIKAFTEDPAFGVVVVPMMTAYAPATVERAAYLCELAKELPKPVCIVWLNEWYQGPGSEVYDRSDALSIFRSMRRCLRALEAWFDYHDHREGRLAAPAPRLTAPATGAAARSMLSAHSTATLSERASKQILAAYGIPVTREKLARSATDAVAMAAEIGYPVALKAESPAIAHKTEAQVVHLNLQNEEALLTAYRAIEAAIAAMPSKPNLDGVLVQEMVPSGVEVMIGARRDPQFGPLVVCGLGGVMVEIFEDTATALAPVDRRRARTMLESLKAHPLLGGYRGRAAVNVEALVEAIVRISELAADLGDDISELDVNPLIATGDRVVAVDALIALQRRSDT